MTLRTTTEQKTEIEAKAAEHGFDSVGAWNKFMSINTELTVAIQKPTTATPATTNN